MIVTNCIDEYFHLIKTRPNLFTESQTYPIITDRSEIEKFQQETGQRVGVIYKSRHIMLVVDLIKDENGTFLYERIIPTAQGKAVVCVPIIDGKLVLLNQYRHSIRNMQLCFPRGFGEDGLSAEDNAKKEIFEEIGGCIERCVHLGSVAPDSGLTSTECEVFVCYLTSFSDKNKTEGIYEILLLSEQEVETKIKNREIKDAFTLSAYTLFKTRRKE